MPAKLSVQRLQDDIKLEQVQKNLDAYAIGILIFEQRRVHASQASKRRHLLTALKALEQSDSKYTEIKEELRKLDEEHSNVIGFS